MINRAADEKLSEVAQSIYVEAAEVETKSRIITILLKACSGKTGTGFLKFYLEMETLQADLFYSGLSGLQLNIPQYLYPPPFENASRLTYYASLFNSIEINSSFYKIPKAATVAKWAACVPENFKFTFKLWKGITVCCTIQNCNHGTYKI